VSLVSRSVAGLLFVLAAPRLPAQSTSASLDLSAARMRFADSVDAAALSISPMLRVVGPRHTLDAFGTFSRLGDAWSNAGSVEGSAVAARLGAMAVDVGGIAGGSLHSGGTRTGQLLGAGRLRAGFESGEAWAGARAGLTWDAQWRPLRQLDLGGWIRRGAVTMALSVLPTAADDTIRFTDTFLMWRRDAGQWTLAATLGVRAGAQLPSLPANRKTWGNVGATLAISNGLALVASGGTYPVDFTQGYPGGQFLSLGLRIRSASGADAAVAPPTSEVHDFRARGTGRVVELRVLAPRARVVELQGDFTEWSAVRLSAQGGGWWVLSLPIAPGVHEVGIRVDGGRWLVPPGLTPRNDEFGTSTGVLTVR
jgi:hypothetical protein